jgi:hypothetical protein
VTLALSIVAVLTVALPAAAPVLAVAGDTVKITPSAITGGANNSTFTARVSSNTVTPLKAIQASVTFDKTVLQVVSITRVSGFWGSATLPVDGSDVATSNLNGKVATWAASYLTTPGSPTNTDVPFLDIVFKVVACPASGSAGNLALPIGPADTQITENTSGNTVDPASVSGSTVSCTPPAANDFSLSASPNSLTIPQGGSNQSTVTATLTSGVAELVTLSTSGVPANVTANFTSSTVTPTGSTNLTINVGAAAVIGPYTITISGTSASNPAPGRTTTLTLNVTAPPAGPSPATGTTTVTGTVEAGFLGASVQASTQLRLRRNGTNETSVPVVIFSNTIWTLSIADAMLPPKAAADRGHMLDTGATPTKRLTDPMQAYVPVAAPALPLIRTLDIAGPQSLWSGSANATVNVTLSQVTKPADPPGNYAIDVSVPVMSGF